MLNNVSNAGENFSSRLYEYILTSTKYTGYTIDCDFSDFYSKINTEFYDVPFIYYKGYVANLEREDGSIINLNVGKNNLNGMVRVYLPKNEQGKIHIWYNGTKIFYR